MIEKIHSAGGGAEMRDGYHEEIVPGAGRTQVLEGHVAMKASSAVSGQAIYMIPESVFEANTMLETLRGVYETLLADGLDSETILQDILMDDYIADRIEDVADADDDYDDAHSALEDEV